MSTCPHLDAECDLGARHTAPRSCGLLFRNPGLRPALPCRAPGGVKREDAPNTLGTGLGPCDVPRRQLLSLGHKMSEKKKGKLLFEQDLLRRVTFTKPGALRFDTEPSGPRAGSLRSLAKSVSRHLLYRRHHRPARSGQPGPGVRSDVPRGSAHREPHGLAHLVTDRQLAEWSPQNAGSAA